MLYEAPVDNLKCLMRSCTVLSRSGLYRFFSSQLTQAQVDFLINALASQRVLDIDEQDYELIWFHRMGLKTSRLRPEYVKAKIRAFWVIRMRRYSGCNLTGPSDAVLLHREHVGRER